MTICGNAIRLLPLFVALCNCVADSDLREAFNVSALSAKLQDLVEDSLQVNNFQVCVFYFFYILHIYSIATRKRSIEAL